MKKIIKRDKNYYYDILKTFKNLKYDITEKKLSSKNMATFYVCYSRFYKKCEDLSLNKKFYREIEVILQRLGNYLNESFKDNEELEKVYDIIERMRKDYQCYLVSIN